MMVGSLSRLLRVHRRGSVASSSDAPPLEQLESSNNQKQMSNMPSFYPIKSFAGVLAMILAILRTNIRSTNNYKMRSTTLKIDAYGPKTGDYSSSLRSDQHSSGVDRRFPRTVVISSHTGEQTSLTDAPYTTKNNFQIDGNVSSTNSIFITPEWYEPNSLELIRGYNLNVCKPKHDWQSSSFLNCNILHETDLLEMKLINHGTTRLVFEMSEKTINRNVKKKVVFKTLMMTNLPLTPRWIDRERKDALVSERATGSRFIPSIHGYCSHAEIMAHAPLDLNTYNQKRLTRNITISSLDRLKIGIHIASGLADLHSVDFTHNDLKEAQFIYHDGLFKLNDFNFARAMYIDKNTNETCPLSLPQLKRHQLRQSLEELQYRLGYERYTPSTPDKNDVWNMGKLLYTILTDRNKFTFSHDKGDKLEQFKRFVAGKRPWIPQRIEKSNDTALVAMMNALNMTWTYNWKERPSARAIANHLMRGLREITGEESPDIRIQFCR